MRRAVYVCRAFLPMRRALFSNTQSSLTHDLASSTILIWVFDNFLFANDIWMMKMSLIVMALIFVLQKPTFLCFSFDIFSLLIQTLFYLFPLWLFGWNDETPGNCLQGWLACDFGKGDQGYAWRFVELEKPLKLHIYYKKQIWRFLLQNRVLKKKHPRALLMMKI